MLVARPHRSFPRSAGSKRQTDWIGPALQGFIAVASGGATIIHSFPFETSGTIVRVRGNIAVKPQAVSADLSIVGAYGMAVVSAEAFTAGVASVPEPMTDADWAGWFVWRSFSYSFEFNDATGINFVPWNFEVDSKAMRRVRPNEVIVGVAESFVGAYSISAPLRVLEKLT